MGEHGCFFIATRNTFLRKLMDLKEQNQLHNMLIKITDTGNDWTYDFVPAPYLKAKPFFSVNYAPPYG
jgi:hypothetical protein